MTETRRKLFDAEVKAKRIKLEDGKWWALCKTCTGRRDENMYYVVRKQKSRSIEDCCMDVLQDWSVYTCKHNTKERVR
jgi:hypothetical protein